MCWVKKVIRNSLRVCQKEKKNTLSQSENAKHILTVIQESDNGAEKSFTIFVFT